MERIILFDGECHFCDHSVQFIIRRDPDGLFKFASLQSEIGKKLLQRHNPAAGLDSFVLIEGDEAYFLSTGALRVCKHLQGGWIVLYSFVVIPRPIRDFVYRIIARNRYKWFGKKEICTIPSSEERKRFL